METLNATSVRSPDTVRSFHETQEGPYEHCNDLRRKMTRHAESDDWEAYCKAESRLLNTRTSRLKETGPKILHLAKMMGCSDSNNIDKRIIRSLLRDIYGT